ncbi:MAG: head decoration protein [Comamonadaceae bacterium]|nr:MAG: head decoration protein [Comamonadaceae bacterium]
MTDRYLAGGVAAADSPVSVELIAGNTNLLASRKGTLVAGQNLKRGALLGKVSAGGAFKLSLSTATDGSEVPTAVLVHDTDATAAAKEILFYERGDFNQAAITFGAAHTADTVRAGLRTLGITLIKPYGVA